MVTDTGNVSVLLDRAARRWPEVEDRKELLLRLAELGDETLAREDRLAAIDETAGVLSGVYPPHALERLRDDWPE